MKMGSTCCKRFEIKKSPILPNFNWNLFPCSEQFEIKRKQEETKQPQPRKFKPSDISMPIPIENCPKRPPRKRKCKIKRCRSLVIKNQHTAKLVRHKSIHNMPVRETKRIEVKKEKLSQDVLPLNTNIKINKTKFLEGMLSDEKNNNIITPVRKDSITESLREFEISLCDMLEETKSDCNEDDRWKPQIPVMINQ